MRRGNQRQIGPTQHWHLPAIEHDAMPARHAGHEEATHPPPLLDDDDALEPPEHVPALHVALAPSWVQSVHGLPPVPQVAVSVPVWHMPLMLSQQPVAQFVESHVPPPLLDEVELPPSSPLPLLVAPLELVEYPLELPAELDEPDELPPFDPPLLVVKAPDEVPLVHLPSSAGSGADVAQAAAATAPASSSTFVGAPRWRMNICDSLRGPHRETTQYDPIKRRLWENLRHRAGFAARFS